MLRRDRQRANLMNSKDTTVILLERTPLLVTKDTDDIVHVNILERYLAQLGENGTEIVRLFARLALGASFLSAVADRFGLWGPYGAKNVSWGNFAHFVEYTGAVTSLFPSSLTVSFAWAATVAETLFGILLIAGFKIRITSVLSGLLLLSFAFGMVTGLGIKTPFDYSVFSAAAAAFLLAFSEPDRFTWDRLLNRLRN